MTWQCGRICVQYRCFATVRGVRLARVVIELHQPTRHGDKRVAILTHLPRSIADAETITQLYLRRWNIEGMFQVITDTFNCELNTLGYPQAALFVFCVAIVAFNILSIVKAALKSVHGVGAESSSF